MLDMLVLLSTEAWPPVYCEVYRWGELFMTIFFVFVVWIGGE